MGRNVVVIVKVLKKLYVDMSCVKVVNCDFKPHHTQSPYSARENVVTYTKSMYCHSHSLPTIWNSLDCRKPKARMRGRMRGIIKVRSSSHHKGYSLIYTFIEYKLSILLRNVNFPIPSPFHLIQRQRQQQQRRVVMMVHSIAPRTTHHHYHHHHTVPILSTTFQTH